MGVDGDGDECDEGGDGDDGVGRCVVDKGRLEGGVCNVEDVSDDEDGRGDRLLSIDDADDVRDEVGGVDAVDEGSDGGREGEGGELEGVASSARRRGTSIPAGSDVVGGGLLNGARYSSRPGSSSA